MFRSCFIYCATVMYFVFMSPFIVQAESVDLTTVSIDIVSLETMAGTVLVALAVMWGIRKLIKTINRS